VKIPLKMIDEKPEKPEPVLQKPTPARERLADELRKLQTHDPDVIPIQGGDYGKRARPDGLKVICDESDAEQISHAESVFYKYLKEGWIAFNEDETGKKQILSFDPKLTRIVLIPPIGGG
jgi:hypothetical protein